MINIHIPKGKEAPDLNTELSSARRIKNKVVRKSTISGLNKIAHYL